MKEQTYLIVESNGKILRAPQATAMNYETTRALIQERFPGCTILSPLERPTGPIQVVTVYLSRSRDGRRRISSLEQWGVQ